MSLNRIDSFSKGSVLLFLQNKLKFFKVPKTILINVNEWQSDKNNIINFVIKKFKNIRFLAIRSSSINEDNKKTSNAGKYHSELFVESNNKKKITDSINKVISKYEKKNLKKNQIIIQEMILNPDISGVLFTREPNTNAPYYVVNYDDISGLTDTVTSGSSEFSNKSLNVYRDKYNYLRSPRFKKLIKSTKELEKLFNTQELDIEFCIKNLNIYLFQVRQLTNLKNWKKKTNKFFKNNLKHIEKKIIKSSKKQKGLFGKKNVFGQMPDWNPAEIIGQNPKPLAYSLYRKLITDKVWAIAREKMEYKKLNDKSLMINFGGLPYINTKLSFNSFLPKKLNKNSSEKLINFWLWKLKNNPKLHDKIEFDIAITCFSFDIEEKINQLIGKILNKKDRTSFKNQTIEQFNKIIAKDHLGSIDFNLKQINLLKEKQKKYNNITDIKTLINDCKKYGTVPFSILARHAFISKSILNSLYNLKIISNKDISNFYSNISSVATDFINDVNNLKKNQISRKKFNSLYGHLRPGTYDIDSKRYDETNYINISNKDVTKIEIHNKNIFNLNQRKKISKILKKFKINLSVEELIDYMKNSFSSREYAKLIFTKNVSQILKSIKKISSKNGFKIKDIAYLKIENFISVKNKLFIKKIKKEILINKQKYQLSRSTKLAQIIHDSNGAFIAPFQMNLPNYISNKKISGKVVDLSENSSKKINNKIVLIENADPGYDWIFTYKIKGLITKYGGVNSHMAIRCREFDLPAAIGCGPQFYNEIKNKENITLDCSVNKIEI